MPDRVFLTDTRREVLAGKYEGAPESEYSHRSRIRSRSRLALNELIEVAESPEIDNSDVFEPEEIFRLLRAILTPNPEQTTKEAGIIGPDNYDEEFQQYADRMHVQLDKFLRFRHSIDDD